ncbi:diguanylate cyclase [Pseudogracilibacillus sp. ICA-222130]
MLTTIINLCVLFTFSVLLYIYSRKINKFASHMIIHNISIGVFSAAIGLILIQTSIQVTPEVWIDTRTVPIILSGIFGGPIALFTSGFLLGFVRIMIGGFSSVAILAGCNTIISTILLILLSKKLPLNYKNAKYFFNLMIVQTGIVLLYITGVSTETLFYSFYFILFTNFSFYVVIRMMLLLEEHFYMFDVHRKESEVDILTGLHNRRKLLQITETYMKQRKEPFSIILLDIDNFKQINDTYGHQIGDEVLKSFARQLQEIGRKYDGDAYRFGGEEFIVFVPRKDEEEVKGIGQSIQRQVAEKIHYVDNERKVQFTISSGASTFPVDGRTVEELYRKADKAMYYAKNDGKNKFYHCHDKKKVSISN